MKTLPVNFPITIFEDNSEKISDTITKKRVGIFYKGLNRNGGYIDDEFADKLLSTLPYAPIKGIYDTDEGDFTDHGTSRDLGRIYGVVPQDFNLAWEKHLDSDGVEREYACADAYLYTALYKEANEIDGKGQSMELYPPSVKGEWISVKGKQVYKYSSASFLGLQVLGDNAIPCFQGSSFFSLEKPEGQQIYTLLTNLLEKIDKLTIGGSGTMDTELTFALSDNQKQNAISKSLNTEMFRYIVMDSYEDYALVYDLEEDKTKKVGFTKNEDDSITVAEEFEEVYTEYVNKEEKQYLEDLRKKTCATAFSEIFAAFEKLDATILDKDTVIATFEQEKKEAEEKNEEEKNKLKEEKDQLESTLAEKNAELETLHAYKDSIEKSEKEGILNKFSTKLNEEIISKYRDGLDSYTVQDLKAALAVELVDNHAEIFTLEQNTQSYVPQEVTYSGIEAIIAQHKK